MPTSWSVNNLKNLEDVAQQLNGRPRKTLGWDTPAERLRDLEASITAQHLYTELMFSDDLQLEHFDPVRQARERIETVRSGLRLLAATDAEEQSTRLREAIGDPDLGDAVIVFNFERRQDSVAERKTSDATEAARARFYELMRAVARAEAEFTLAIRNELEELRPAKSGDS